eukprot:3567873-Rhodomonas_salina.1
MMREMARMLLSSQLLVTSHPKTTIAQNGASTKTSVGIGPSSGTSISFEKRWSVHSSTYGYTSAPSASVAMRLKRIVIKIDIAAGGEALSVDKPSPPSRSSRRNGRATRQAAATCKNRRNSRPGFGEHIPDMK